RSAGPVDEPHAAGSGSRPAAEDDPLPSTSPVSGRAAVVQMTSSAHLDDNLAVLRRLLRQSRDEGAQLVALPEDFAFMGARDTDKLALVEAPGIGPIQTFLAQQARELQLWIIAGTVPLQVPDDAGRVAPASLLFDAQGECVARYDKIHLFDVDLPERN